VEDVVQLNNFSLDPDESGRVMFTYNIVRDNIFWFLGYGLFTGVMLIALPRQSYIFIGGFVLFAVLMLGARFANAIRLVRSPADKAFWQGRIVEFDSSQIRIASSDGSRMESPIRNFIKCGDHKGYFLLHATSRQLILIPKSAFKSLDDEAIFRRILSQYNLLPPPAKA